MPDKENEMILQLAGELGGAIHLIIRQHTPVLASWAMPLVMGDVYSYIIKEGVTEDEIDEILKNFIASMKITLMSCMKAKNE